MNIFDLKGIPEEFVSLEFYGHNITVKKRISEATKLFIANKIKDFYFLESDEETDVSTKDFKNAIYICSVLTNYTSIDLGEGTNYIEIADIAVLSGLWSKVISCIPIEERIMLKEVIDNAIAEEYRKQQESNSVENQLKNFLEWIKEKIPSKEEVDKLVSTLPETINKIEPDKLKFVQDAIKAMKIS